jgi:uncharacterized protein
MTRTGRLPLSLALAAALLGGAGCGVLTANNKELLRADAMLAAGDPGQALAALGTRNDLPGKLERATVLASMGQLEQSNDEFDRALVDIRTFEARATLSATEGVHGAGSLLINDKTLEYQGQGYEKVLLHTLKARNYLLLGDEEGARVEIRNSNMRQDEERERHRKAIEEAQEDASKNKVDAHGLSAQIDQKFAPSAAILQRLDNVYQNPFATYLSGVVYEVNGEPDDAFIDYSRAYEMVPNRIVADDLARVGAATQRGPEVRKIGLTVPARGGPPAGDTLVIVDNGLAPEREELKFPLPGPGTVLFAAVPMTRAIPTNMSEAEILDADGRVLGRSEVMVDIEAMAVRNLRDLYPGILIRQLIRLVGKAIAGKEASDQLGLGGAILSSAFNAVTEQADLRAWYGLPRSIHVARVRANGSPELTVRILGAADAVLREVKVPLITGSQRLRVVTLRYLDGQVMIAAPPERLQTARHEGGTE